MEAVGRHEIQDVQELLDCLDWSCSSVTKRNLTLRSAFGRFTRLKSRSDEKFKAQSPFFALLFEVMP